MNLQQLLAWWNETEPEYTFAVTPQTDWKHGFWLIVNAVTRRGWSWQITDDDQMVAKVINNADDVFALPHKGYGPGYEKCPELDAFEALLDAYHKACTQDRKLNPQGYGH